MTVRDNCLDAGLHEDCPAVRPLSDTRYTEELLQKNCSRNAVMKFE
jgi:hypothetical protein